MSADETAKVRPGGALDSLAAVRLFPALFIFTAHVTQYRLFAEPAVQSVSSGVFNKVGYESVSFFIVLSGFILTWVALRQGAGRLFTARRLLKIVPTHVVTWAVCIAVLGSTALLPELANLALIQGWFPQPSVYFTANIPAWTLCVEVLFYALFPLLFRVLRGLGTRALATLLVTLVAAVILLPALLSALPNGTTFTEPAFTQAGHQVQVSEWKFWLVYIFPVSRLVESVIGMLICLLVARGGWPVRSVLGPLGLLAAACAAATLWSPFLYATSAVTIAPIVLLIGSAAAADRERRRSVLRIRPLVPFAGYTFNFYLAQWVVITYWKTHILPANGYGVGTGLFTFALLFALTALFANGLHNLLEVPVTRVVMDRLRRRWGPGPRSAPPVHGAPLPAPSPTA